MKRATYMGTHNSTMTYGHVRIPSKISNQIRLREGTIPDFFYGLPRKSRAFPYIHIVHPEDLQENQIKTINGEDISNIIHRIEVRGYKRLVIPIELREFAELYKGVHFIGNFDHFEIWNKRNATKQEKASNIYLAQHPKEVENLHNILGL